MKNNQSPRSVKICAISDTHGNLTEMQKALESGLEGDIFIHAGDFTSYNKRDHFADFVKILSQLKFQHKIVIPGNHQIILDGSIPDYQLKHFGIFVVKQDMKRQVQIQRLKEIGVTYLQHDYAEVGGVKIFASSYTVTPPYWSTAFQISEDKMDQIWEGVPVEIDLLITHGPPYEILDKTIAKENVGSRTIKNYLEKTHARAHVFGHIHEAKGQIQLNQKMFYNVAQRMTVFQLKITDSS